MKKIPKQLQWIFALMILWVVFWVFKNIALVISIILWIIILILLYFTFKDYIIENKWRITKKEISIIPLFLILFPWYFLIWILLNYDEYNKTFQEKWINAFSEVWKAMIMMRRPKLYIKKEIKREVRKDLREGSGSLVGN